MYAAAIDSNYPSIQMTCQSLRYRSCARHLFERLHKHKQWIEPVCVAPERPEECKRCRY